MAVLKTNNLQRYVKIKSISALIPALNERDNLAPTVERLLRALSITVEDYELIIINDGSTDGTGEIADTLARDNSCIRVIHNSKPMGLGYAYVEGVKEASKNYFVYIPGDNTWPYRSFIELLGNLGKADIITSFSTNSGVRPFGRRIISKLYTETLNFLFGKRLHYYNGLTIYPIEFLRLRPITTFGFGFQSEALLKAIYSGFSFIEVGIPIDERTVGSSKAVTIKNIVSVLCTLFTLFLALRILKKTDEARYISSISPGRINTKTSSSPDELGFRPEKNQSAVNKTKAYFSKPLIIVITGASSGIGAKLMQHLSLEGHKLFVCARNKEKLIKSTNDFEFITSEACDVSKEEEVISFANFLKNKTDKIDVLINCAGKFGSIGAIEKTKSEEWLDTIKVNLFGPYLMIKYLLPLLKQSQAGKIINFSGGGAFSPFPNYSAYAASKTALIRLTETLSIELAPHEIMVNAIAPGIIATPAHLATLEAGEELAGKMQYQRTKVILEGGGASLDNVVNCVRMLISEEYNGLTGKTISANFDPWETKAFQKNISKISCSDLYTLSRINIVNLPEGNLRSTLSEIWSAHEA